MNWKQKPFDDEQYSMLRHAGLVPLFCTLISNRAFSDVRTKTDVQKLVTAPFSMIESPLDIPNMDIATKIILQNGEEDAVVFGDYDVDGITSSFMCERLLKDLGARSVDVYLPSRVNDGYGLNPKSVKNFLSICQKDYALVVVLDCGSSSHDQIENIKERLPNAKIVVIDHHIISEDSISSNADVIVNWRLGDCTPYCTAGLVYQLSRLCGREKRLNDNDYLPYAAIGTIADVCEMVHSNRIIVRNGLEALSAVKDPGLLALLEISEVKIKDCNPEDISFKIGPLLNASGRIKVAKKAYRLLKSGTKEDAHKRACELKKLNEERRAIQQKIAEEAISQFEERKIPMKSALLYSEQWNPGVVGIVASKITEKYHVPTICFGMSNGAIKGSARSVQGINIKEVMDICSHIFLKYGGHEMAAGATLDPVCLETAWDTFNEAVLRYMDKNNIGEPSVYYDYEVDPDLLLKIDEVFCERLVKLEPYGSGNEMPVFRANNVFCSKVKEWRSGKGGFVNLDNTSLQAFGFFPELQDQLENCSVDILFSLVRSFLPGDKWQIKIIDFK